jgi:hypothetical protein
MHRHFSLHFSSLTYLDARRGDLIVRLLTRRFADYLLAGNRSKNPRFIEHGSADYFSCCASRLLLRCLASISDDMRLDHLVVRCKESISCVF